MKQMIRLTESDLHNLVKESVNKIMDEAKRGKKFRSPRDDKWTDGQWSRKKKGGDKPWNKQNWKKFVPSTTEDEENVTESRMNRALRESYADDRYDVASFCNSGDKKYDHLSGELFKYIEDWGISSQMQENYIFQEGRKMLEKALKTLERAFRTYNEDDYEEPEYPEDGDINDGRNYVSPYEKMGRMDTAI